MPGVKYVGVLLGKLDGAPEALSEGQAVGQTVDEAVAVGVRGAVVAPLAVGGLTGVVATPVGLTVGVTVTVTVGCGPELLVGRGSGAVGVPAFGFGGVSVGGTTGAVGTPGFWESVGLGLGEVVEGFFPGLLRVPELLPSLSSPLLGAEVLGDCEGSEVLVVRGEVELPGDAGFEAGADAGSTGP